MAIGKNIVELIGNTRMVDISHLVNKQRVKVVAKLEGENPGGSVKDRPAKQMIIDAIERGELTKEKIIIDASSGNTGISLAMIGATLGYKVIIALPDNVSAERQKLIRAYGAEIILTPGIQGTDGAIRKVREIVSQDTARYFYPDQYSNPSNPRAHRKTADEIWEQTNGKITHIALTIGTSGTMMGVGKRLRELKPSIKIIEIMPVPEHKIQGLKNMQESMVPSIYDTRFADHQISVKDNDAFDAARQLAKHGLLVGMSSGAALQGSMQAIMNPKIVNPEKDCNFVVIFPDSGMKYLSTSLFDKV